MCCEKGPRHSVITEGVNTDISLGLNLGLAHWIYSACLLSSSFLRVLWFRHYTISRLLYGLPGTLLLMSLTKALTSEVELALFSLLVIGWAKSRGQMSQRGLIIKLYLTLNTFWETISFFLSSIIPLFGMRFEFYSYRCCFTAVTVNGGSPTFSSYEVKAECLLVILCRRLRIVSHLRGHLRLTKQPRLKVHWGCFLR